MENKIKVGIITLVSTINYGTGLQAYATEKIFKKLLGEKYSVEVLNIEIWKGIENNTLINKVKNIARVLLRPRISYLHNKMKRFMHEFVENDIDTSPKMYCPTYRESLSFLESRGYNIYISGSDEIWANKPGKPFPNIYFIPPNLEGLKISFASSVNRGDLETLTENQKTELTASFESYDYISVRDDYSERFVHSFVANPVNVIYDPTFLCDFPTVEYYHKEIAKARKNNKKIICLMILNRRVANEIIEKYSKEYLIVSMYSLHSRTCMLVPTPLQFTSIFKQFDLVITNYFHGTIFCIKNNTPFISIDNEEIYKKYESKIANMLKRLDLTEHYLTIWDNSPTEYGILHEKIKKVFNRNESIDYCKAQEKIRSECQPDLEKIRDLIVAYSVCK